MVDNFKYSVLLMQTLLAIIDKQVCMGSEYDSLEWDIRKQTQMD